MVLFFYDVYLLIPYIKLRKMLQEKKLIWYKVYSKNQNPARIASKVQLHRKLLFFQCFKALNTFGKTMMGRKVSSFKIWLYI
uniref:Uncharacterized protein n=1 Tax=Pararge aegeria TaxID=116150 RepID=S4NS57_9NEOP